MKDEHIIGILDGAPFSALSESELASVRTHVDRCVECLRAFEAAQLTSRLLIERVDEAAGFAPSPFFQTRVLAALRERRAADEAPALKRLWRAAGALVSSMAVTVAALLVVTLTVVDTDSTPATLDVAGAPQIYSEEAVLLAQDEMADGEIDYGQVLSSIYQSENAEGDDGQDR